jgi:DNA helicase IV
VLTLTGNLRNSREIHEFVRRFHPGKPPETRGPEVGRPVEILAYRDEDDLARDLTVVLRQLTEDDEVPLEDIVVLTPSRKSKSELRRRGGVDGFQFSDDPEKGAVLTSTVHAFKGLERPVVILAEIGERHEEQLEQYLYVGGSRARHHLVVLATQPVAERLRASGENP